MATLRGINFLKANLSDSSVWEKLFDLIVT